MSDQAAQERLFDPTRYSPVRVEVLQCLPESSARAFEIAAARGKSASGTRARIARVLAQLRKELDRE